MIEVIISTLLQLIVFSIIPLIVHLSRKKTLTGFFKYIGLTQSNLRANLYAFLVAIVIAGPVIMLGILNDDFRDILSHPESVTGSLKQMGWNLQTGVIILIVALFKTALAEEILFRGFLAKRLISLNGFQTGNIIQAIIFGLIHAILFFTITRNIWFLVIIFVFPTIGAYLKVYLNEKLAHGSIIPGWIAHGFGNELSYSLVVFIL